MNSTKQWAMVTQHYADDQDDKLPYAWSRLGVQANSFVFCSTSPEYPGSGNPWRISYGMDQHTSLNFVNGAPVTVGDFIATAFRAQVTKPADTYLVGDLSYRRNHPPIENLTTNHVGYRHGTRFPDGRAITGYVDGHVDHFDRTKTNGVILEFKQ